MKITDNSQSPTVARALALFQQHYQDAQFLGAVETTRFNFTRDLGTTVAQKIRDAHLIPNLEIVLESYHAPKSKAVASTTTRQGVKVIRFNQGRKEAPDVASRVETLMHEFLHCLSYAHLTNFNWCYNEGTVPYRGAKIFIDTLKQKNIPLNDTDP